VSIPAPFIGTLSERSLHAQIKRLLAGDDGLPEVELDGCVVDVLQTGLVLEIQTRGFSRVRPKLKRLLQTRRVRLVHPIAVEKRIVKVSPEGEVLAGARRSPRKGRPADVFAELVSIPDLLCHPRFSLELLMIVEQEVRCPDGQGAWRRKGVSVVDHCLVEIRDRLLLQQPADLLGLLSAIPTEPFTVPDLAAAAGLRPRLAGQTAYCLKHAGVIRDCGRRGRAVLYQMADAAEASVTERT